MALALSGELSFATATEQLERGRELRVSGAPEQLRRLAEFFGVATLLSLGS
jgi:hypothetical protein